MVITVFQYLFPTIYRYDTSIDKSSIFDTKLRQKKYGETYVKRTPSENALVSA